MHGLEYENVMHLFVGNPKTSEVLPKFRGLPGSWGTSFVKEALLLRT